MADEETKTIDLYTAHHAIESIVKRLGELIGVADLFGLVAGGDPPCGARTGLVGLLVGALEVKEFLEQGNPECSKCRRLQRQINWLKRTYDPGDQSDMLRCLAESCEFQHEVSNKQGHCHNIYEVMTSTTLPDELKDAAQTMDLLARERDETNKALRACFDNCLDINVFPKLPEKADDQYEAALIGDDVDDGAGGCVGSAAGDEPEEAIINAVARARELGHLPPEEEKKDGDHKV